MITNYFLDHCENERKLSKKTLKAYYSDLCQFENYLIEKHSFNDFKSVKKNHLREYILFLKNYSSRTIKRKVATLKAFYNFLEFEDEILESPFKKIRLKIKDQKILPSFLNIDEVENILRTLYNKKKQAPINTYKKKAIIRDIAVTELLFATGIRVSELCSLKKSDFKHDFSSIKIFGKGHKERIIPITNKGTVLALTNYYNLFNKNINSSKEEYFFINRLNNRLSDQSVRLFIKKISNESGIISNVTPHVFRHTFATLLLEANVNLRYIQKLLGHSSINVTQIYTHVSSRKTHEILNLKHPRNQLFF